MPKIDGRLTKQRVDALRLVKGHGEETYWDGHMPGFGVRLRADAAGRTRKYFLVQYRNASGQSRKVGIGYFGAPWTVDASREHAQRLLQQAGEGRDPAEERKQRLAEESFANAFERYIGERSRGADAMKPSTVARNRDLMRLYVAPAFGGKKLSAITQADVAALRSRLLSEGKERTAHMTVGLIKALFRWLQRQGIKIDNPAEAFKVKGTEKRARPIKESELKAFFSALEDEPNITARDAFVTMLLTGARRENVLSMRWDQLDLTHRRWHIPETKNGTSFELRLSTEAGELLRTRPRRQGSPWVFPSPGARRGYLAAVAKPMNRICARTEYYLLRERLGERDVALPDLSNKTTADALATMRALAEEHQIDSEGTRFRIRVHDLRASYATFQAMLGRSALELQALLNHKTMAMAGVYVRLGERSKLEANDELASHVLVKAGRKPTAEVVELDRLRTARR